MHNRITFSSSYYKYIYSSDAPGGRRKNKGQISFGKKNIFYHYKYIQMHACEGEFRNYSNY